MILVKPQFQTINEPSYLNCLDMHREHYLNLNNKTPEDLPSYLLEGSLLVNEKYCGNAQQVIARNKIERQKLLSEGALKEVSIKNEDGTIDDYYQYECQRDICFARILPSGRGDTH
jgi:hypothetical protein